MNKFKFGERVWHEEYGLGVVRMQFGDTTLCLFENSTNSMVLTEKLTLATDWVKCSERMPELNVPVLVVDQNGIDLGAIYDGDDWFLADAEREITHWMPLPAPPHD